MDPRPRPRLALLAALAGVGGLVVAWLATYSRPGRWIDQSALVGFLGLRRPRTAPVADFIAHLGDPLPFALVGVALVVVALLRRRPRVALAVPMVLVGANLTTQVLKPLLPDDRMWAALEAGAHITGGSWPSGHATASMALALAAVMVVPGWLRPAVATIGAGFAVAVSYSLLALGWHFPSDVMAGYCVAAVWVALAVAALWAAAIRWPAPARSSPAPDLPQALAPQALASAACAGAAGLVFLIRPFEVVGYARAHTTFVAGALAIAALSAAMATGLTLVLRR